MGHVSKGARKDGYSIHLPFSHNPLRATFIRVARWRNPLLSESIQTVTQRYIPIYGSVCGGVSGSGVVCRNRIYWHFVAEVIIMSFGDVWGVCFFFCFSYAIWMGSALCTWLQRFGFGGRVREGVRSVVGISDFSSEDDFYYRRRIWEIYIHIYMFGARRLCSGKLLQMEGSCLCVRYCWRKLWMWTQCQKGNKAHKKAGTNECGFICMSISENPNRFSATDALEAKLPSHPILHDSVS